MVRNVRLFYYQSSSVQLHNRHYTTSCLTRSVKVQVWGGQTDISEWVLRSCHHARSCARALAQQRARRVADVANVDVLANLNVVAADDGSKVVARLHHIEQGYELD